MNLWILIWREIAHRKLNFALSLLTVILAVTCAVSVVTLLRGHELRTHNRVQALDDQIRQITKDMGFNLMILPKDQNLAEFYATDFAAKTMPEEYVHRLANSGDIITINHLRPALIRKLTWPEQKRHIILMGVRGVVPLAHRDLKKPLAYPVPEGRMNVGHVLAEELGLEPGREVTLLGEAFTVNKIYPQRGNEDDITVWIDLSQAQQMLGLAGRINMIQALECNCASTDRLAEIETEIAEVLGGQVQVVEQSTKAIARAKARNRVAAEGAAMLHHWQMVASAVMPLVILAAGLWVALLSLANVRQRRTEIGIWRALGWHSRRVGMLFICKALLLGLAGSVIGYTVGFFGSVWVQSPWPGASDVAGPQSLFILPLLLLVLLVAPVLAALATWLPALSAMQQDPAQVLREE